MLNNNDTNQRNPNVVLLSSSYDSNLVDYISKLPPHSKNKVHRFSGDCAKFFDLERVGVRSCCMVFIIPSLTAEDRVKEDGQNICRAIQINRYAPDVVLRLMLLDTYSKTHAVKVG